MSDSDQVEGEKLGVNRVNLTANIGLGNIQAYLECTQSAVNARKSEVAAKAAAAEATSEANKAQSSALAASLSANKAEAAEAEAKRISGLDTVTAAVKAELAKTYQYAMTKAEFDQLCENRRRQYTGSGFAEPGKHVKHANYPNVGEGMFTTVLTSGSEIIGELALGEKGSSSATGLSRSFQPIAVVDGIEILLDQGYGSNSYQIPFAEAEDGTRTIDDASGVVTKHATSNEAFEGLLINGDFRHGTANWSNQHVGFTVSGGIATLTTLGAGGSDRIEQGFTLKGDYSFEVTMKVNENALGRIQLYLSGGVSARVDVPPTNGFQTFVVKASAPVSTAMYPQIQTVGSAGSTVEVACARFAPSSERVITSRKDFVFLEVWPEAISDRDVVAIYGNTQFMADKWPEDKGVSLSSVTDLGIGQGYSSFGDWDTKTEGFLLKWSTLSTARKQKFLGNRRNNVYLDEETGELIQIRYRVRNQRGDGDNWFNVMPNLKDRALAYGLNGRRVGIRGSADNTDNDFTGSGGTNHYFGLSNVNIQYRQGDVGYFTSYNAKGINSYDGRNFAIPIALVQRLTKGGFHHVHCPEGTAGWRSLGNPVNIAKWYNCGYEITSKSMCYDLKTSTQAGAADWGSAVSQSPNGRSSTYGAYDAVYAGQVTDLRVSANDIASSDITTYHIRQALAGAMRGSGKVPYTSVKFGVVPDGSGANIYCGNGSALSPKVWGYDDTSASRQNQESRKIPRVAFRVTDTGASSINSKISLNTWYVGKAVRNVDASLDSYAAWYIVPDFVGEEEAFPVVNGGNANTFKVDIIVTEELLDDSYDLIPWVDIVGAPEQLAAVFPNGVVGQWIPKSPTSSEEKFELNKKCNTSNAFVISKASPSDDWVGSLKTVNAGENSVSISGDGSVSLLCYDALSDFTVQSENGTIVGGVGEVVTASRYQVEFGNRMIPSLTGKVGTSTTNFNLPELVNCNYHTIDPRTNALYSSRPPKHAPIDIPAPNVGAEDGAVKALVTLTSEDGLLYLQFHGCELFYDRTKNTASQFTEQLGTASASFVAGTLYRITGLGQLFSVRCVANVTVEFQQLERVGNEWRGNTSNTVYFTAWEGNAWGDDGTIEVVDNEGDKRDLNGNRVKTFCHRSLFPVGFSSKKLEQ